MGTDHDEACSAACTLAVICGSGAICIAIVAGCLGIFLAWVFR